MWLLLFAPWVPVCAVSLTIYGWLCASQKHAPLTRSVPTNYADPLVPIEGTMAAKRCSQHGLNWPTTARYQNCPLCGNRTDYMTNAKAMSEAEAQELAPEIVEKLPTLPSLAEAKIVESWEAIEAEAARRGPSWSCADVLAEGWKPASGEAAA